MAIESAKEQKKFKTKNVSESSNDYNPKVTIYQLNQLSGVSGTTEYKCPSCEKVKSQNLCFPVPACDTIINPLQFGRKRV